MADANQGEWLPPHAIINFKLARNQQGNLITDDDAYVEFHANMGPGDNAFLLYDIRRTTNMNGSAPIYKARVVNLDESRPPFHERNNTIRDADGTLVFNNNVVDLDEARPEDADMNSNTNDDNGTRPATTLFYVHGFNSNVTGVFRGCRTYHEAYPGRMVVPVMWSDQQIGILGYLLDKCWSVDPAGQAFSDFVTIFNEWAFPRRSLVCHSMGNFVLQRVARYVARAELDFVKFDDIFMVAADVSSKVFEQSDGRSILRLTDNYVHVLYSTRDGALKARVWANCFQRALGACGYKETNADNEHRKLRQLDCSARHCDDPIGHSYQFEGWIMEMYEVAMTQAEERG